MADVVLVGLLLVFIWAAVLVPPAAGARASREADFLGSIRPGHDPLEGTLGRATDLDAADQPRFRPALTANARRRQVLGGLVVAMGATLVLGLLPTFRLLLVVHLLLVNSSLAYVGLLVHMRDQQAARAGSTRPAWVAEPAVPRPRLLRLLLLRRGGRRGAGLRRGLRHRRRPVRRRPVRRRRYDASLRRRPVRRDEYDDEYDEEAAYIDELGLALPASNPNLAFARLTLRFNPQTAAILGFVARRLHVAGLAGPGPGGRGVRRPPPTPFARAPAGQSVTCSRRLSHRGLHRHRPRPRGRRSGPVSHVQLRRVRRPRRPDPAGGAGRRRRHRRHRVDGPTGRGRVGRGADHVFARNQLQILVAPGNPLGIASIADLARPDLKVVLGDESAPAGRYAAQALRAAGVTVAPVSREADVKAAVAKVTLGEADATIVYVTDVIAAGARGQGVPIADAQNVVAEYPIAVVKTTGNHAGPPVRRRGGEGSARTRSAGGASFPHEPRPWRTQASCRFFLAAARFYGRGMPSYRIGQAADLLGVSVDTMRRWVDSGRVPALRTDGGQRLIDGVELARFATEIVEDRDPDVVVARSARNRFPGIVTRVVKDTVMAQVEIQAGPHRVVSLMSREAADELGLAPGVMAVAAVKSTSVMVEIAAD